MKILFILLCSSLVCSARELPGIDKFLSVLGQVESSGNPKALNKQENAIGIYQIRSAYFEDAKQFNPELSKYNHNDCFDIRVSRQVVISYLKKYSKSNDFKEWAMLHNGGPGWKKKTGQAKKNLDNYWQRFQARMK